MADSFRGTVESCCVAGEVTAIAVRPHYYAPGGRDINRMGFGPGQGFITSDRFMWTKEIEASGTSIPSVGWMLEDGGRGMWAGLQALILVPFSKSAGASRRVASQRVDGRPHAAM